MVQLTVTFEQEWVEEQRKQEKRVIRLLEKWVASLEGVTLKSASSSKMTVELPVAEREKFLQVLAEQMKSLFGETEPWAHAIFSGSTAGLDVPVSVSAKKTSQKPVPKTDESLNSESEPAAESVPEQISRDVTDDEKKKSEKNSDPVPAAEQKPDPRELLEEICSSVPIKHSRELEVYVRETAEVIPMLQKLGAESTLWHQHLLMAVDAGYGRSQFLHALCKLYKAHGLIKNIDKKSVREFILLEKGQEREDDGYRVAWETVLSTAQDMKNSNARNGISNAVLYIDISAWQTLLTTVEGKNRLRRLNSLSGSFLIVFRMPFVEGHILRETADALNDILNVRTIAVPPAPVDDMIDYARTELAKNGFEIADAAMAPLEQLLLREKVDNSFFGYKTMNKVVQKMIYNKALANCRNQEEDRIINVDDLMTSSFSSSRGEAEEKPVGELSKMIGLQAVERRLDEIIVQIKTQRKLAAKGKQVASPSIHMLFTGNPGTGKTTVARILARKMHQAGILRKGHLIEVKGRDLCGCYVGETAPKTSAICRDAYGSVLFIDEAYSLFRPSIGGADYGREALDTLVAEMDNHRDDLCVIMAGYKEEMDVMLKGNIGLKGRIPFEIEFPNYTREELEKIFFSMLDGVFEYEDGMQNAVHELFAAIPEETFHSREFSNARLVRNLYERTWGKAAYRQSLSGGDLFILKSDLAGAMSDSEFKKLLTKNAESAKKIGFGI